MSKAPAIGPDVINTAAPVLVSVEDSSAVWDPDTESVIPEEFMAVSSTLADDVAEDSMLPVVVITCIMVLSLLTITVEP